MARKKKSGQAKALQSVVDRLASSSFKSSSSNNRRRRPNGSRMQNLGKTIPLMTGSIPKPYVKFSRHNFGSGSADSSYFMEGCELVDEVACQKAFSAPIDQPLNPLNGSLFPRLSAVASAFERYRFLRIECVYHTACPATRSGTVGLMVDFDPDDPQPNSMAVVATHEAGAIGTVARDLSIRAIWPKDDPFYLTTPSDSSSSEDQWRYPGRLWVVMDGAAAADNGAIAGYVTCSYEIEFLRLKPPSTQVLSGSLVPNAIASETESTLEWAIDNAIGWWDWLNSETFVDPSTSGAPRRNETCSLIPGSWDLSWLMDLDAASVASSRPVFVENWQFVGPHKAPQVLRVTTDEKQSNVRTILRKSWINPAVLHRIERRRSRKDYRSRHSFAQLLQQYPAVKFSDFKEPEGFSPLAANDITIRWKVIDEVGTSGTISTIFTDLFNVAGVANIDAMHQFISEIGDGLLHPFLTYQLPAGEERELAFGRVCITPETLVE